VKVVRRQRNIWRSGKSPQTKGLDVDTHVRYGDDAEEILDHAAQKDIGLIAMSTMDITESRVFSLKAWQRKSSGHAQANALGAVQLIPEDRWQ